MNFEPFGEKTVVFFGRQPSHPFFIARTLINVVNVLKLRSQVDNDFECVQRHASDMILDGSGVNQSNSITNQSYNVPSACSSTVDVHRYTTQKSNCLTPRRLTITHRHYITLHYRRHCFTHTRRSFYVRPIETMGQDVTGNGVASTLCAIAADKTVDSQHYIYIMYNIDSEGGRFEKRGVHICCFGFTMFKIL